MIYTVEKECTIVIEVFNNHLEDGDWWVMRCKETKMILYEGHSLPPINIWQNLLNNAGVKLTVKSLTNQQLEELINESDN